MPKCNNCGRYFEPTTEIHYIARDAKFQLIQPEVAEYDAYDCPYCGCQYIAQERKKQSSGSNKTGTKNPPDCCELERQEIILPEDKSPQDGGNEAEEGEEKEYDVK